MEGDHVEHRFNSKMVESTSEEWQRNFFWIDRLEGVPLQELATQALNEEILSSKVGDYWSDASGWKWL